MFKTLESFTASPHCVHTGLWNIRGGMLRKPLKYLLSLLLIITAATRCFAVDDVTLDVTKRWANDNLNTEGTYNVTLMNRSFVADEWDIICFPFSVDENGMKSVFGDDFVLCEPSGVADNTFKFTSLTTSRSITAGKPYLIKSKNTVSNPVFNNVQSKSINWNGETNYVNGDFKFIGLVFTRNYSQNNDASQGIITNSRTAYSMNGHGVLSTITQNSGTMIATKGFFCIEQSNYTENMKVSVDGNILTSSSSGSGSEEGGESGSGSEEGGESGNETPQFSQLTNLPTMYIYDVTETIDNGDGTTTTNSIDLNHISGYPHNSKTESYYNAKVTIVGGNGEVANMEGVETGIRGRGNSTWSSYKKPYRLKFTKKQQLLGTEFAKEKSWTLLANAFDKSMIRNALTYDIGKFFEMPFCPAAQFVDLYLCGEYRGTYQISDQVQIGDKRIPIDSDNGWFLEAVTETNAKEEPYFQISGNRYCINIKNPEDEFLTDAKKEEIKDYCQKAYYDKVLFNDYNDNYTPSTGYRAYWEEKDLVNYYVATELIGNYDAFISCYAYKEDGSDKLHMGPLWDQDIAFGNNNVYNENSGFVKDWGKYEYSIYSYIMKDARFAEQSYLRWKEIYDMGIVSHLTNRIDELASLLEQSQQKNYALGNNNSYGSNKNSWTINVADDAITWGGATHDTYKEYISDLKDYITKRATVLNQLFKENYDNVWKNQGSYTYDITSENNLYSYANKAYTTTIKNRTFTSYKWATICLPFDMTPTRLEYVFGKNYNIREFSGIENNTIKFSIPKNNELTGGVPYLIRIDSDKTGDLDFGTEAVNTYQNSQVSTISFNDYTFKGLITPENATNAYTISADGTKLESLTDGNLNGSYAYITIPDGINASDVNIYIEGFTEDPVVEDLSFNMSYTKDKTDKNYSECIGKTYNFTLTGRGNLYADGWCTICLPFTITKSEFETAIGSDTKLRELNAISGSSFVFEKLADTEKTMVAGRPYLIMIDDADATKTINLDDVSFGNRELGTINGAAISPNNDEYSFVGILSATILKNDGTNLFMGAANKLFKPYADENKNGPICGGKAYFTIPNTTAEAKVMIDGIEDEGTVTGIDEMMIYSKDNIYNLNGQYVGNDINSLSKGIYIKNRKKIIK